MMHSIDIDNAIVDAALPTSSRTHESAMLSHPAIGDYVAQVMNFEEDSLRLLEDTLQFTAAGQARSAAIYKAFFSSYPSAIEKRAIVAANSPRQTPGHNSYSDAAVPAGVLPGKDHLRGDLTLSLFWVDTTWRFDTFNNRMFSPPLSWPAIRKLFQNGTSVEADLILKDYHCQPHVGPIMRKKRSTPLNATVQRY